MRLSGDIARQVQIRSSTDRSRVQHTISSEDKAALSAVVTVYDTANTEILIEADSNFDIGETIEVDFSSAGIQIAEVLWTNGRLVGCKFIQGLLGAFGEAPLSRSLIDATPDGLLHETGFNDTVIEKQSDANWSQTLPFGTRMWIIMGAALLCWIVAGGLAYWVAY